MMEFWEKFIPFKSRKKKYYWSYKKKWQKNYLTLQAKILKNIGILLITKKFEILL